MKIVSLILLLLSAFLSLKHGWDAFQAPTPEQAEMMADLGITESIKPYFGILSVAIGLMLFFPQTFFIGNLLNALVIVWIMAASLSVGNWKMTLIEIPFLALPLLLIWLKYPLKS